MSIFDITYKNGINSTKKRKNWCHLNWS